VFFTGSGKNC